MQISQVQSGTAGTTSAAAGQLGKDAFLQLLITQLRYQNPLSPMNNEAFLGQLAQFSQLEQMQQLNDNFSSSMLLTQSLNNSAAAGLIGKYVRAGGDAVHLPESGSVQLGYYLPQPAASVTLSVLDANGRTVRTLEAPASDAGSQQLTWDGRSEDGARLEAGEYRLAVDAVDAEGNPLQALTLIEGRVDGVTFENGTAVLLVDGQQVPLSSVLDVFVPATEGGDGQ